MNISLIGYRGVGKSTLGKLLAEKLNRKFVDVDELIVAEIGTSIKEYFQEYGEKSFRELESSTIATVMNTHSNSIISLGGGAILDAKNIFEIKSNSKIVFLDADKELLIQRLTTSYRPTLTNLPLDEEITHTLKQRYPLYIQCSDTVVKINGYHARKNLSELEKELENLRVEIAKRVIRFEARKLEPYQIMLQRGIFKSIANMVNGSNKYLIICDSNIHKLYASDLRDRFITTGKECNTLQFPAGESNKNLDTFAVLHEQIAQSLDRESCIVALGGGVTGDIAGFVASTFMRGIPFIQIPTSLLAMVDSSIGGKLGVNSSKGKNLIGTFRNPQTVFIDPLFLHTLPQENLVDGFAEVVKHALIQDESYFNFILENSNEILSLNTDVLLELIYRSLEIKLSIVKLDEIENNLRRKLNFGHTIGHALEKALDYKMISHGSAVAIGMVAALHISLQRELIDQESFEKIKGCLSGFALPQSLNDLSLDVSRSDVLRSLEFDKKRISGKLNFILLEGIGRSVVVDDISQEEIIGAINYVS